MKLTKTEFQLVNNKFDEYKNKSNKSFEYIQGKNNILISAPHSVSQFRNGKIKGKDMCTGTIAITLQKSLNCHCIYKTKNYNDDANYDIENNTYKDKILEVIKERNIKFLLDIHGAKNYQGFDIDIGTNNLKTLRSQTGYAYDFRKLGKEYGILNITIDKIFKASTLNTISNYISEKAEIPCMQIEISKEYRDIENFSKLETLLNFLEDYLKRISGKEEK